MLNSFGGGGGLNSSEFLLEPPFHFLIRRHRNSFCFHRGDVLGVLLFRLQTNTRSKLPRSAIYLADYSPLLRVAQRNRGDEVQNRTTVIFVPQRPGRYHLFEDGSHLAFQFGKRLFDSKRIDPIDCDQIKIELAADFVRWHPEEFGPRPIDDIELLSLVHEAAQIILGHIVLYFCIRLPSHIPSLSSPVLDFIRASEIRA